MWCTKTPSFPLLPGPHIKRIFLFLYFFKKLKIAFEALAKIFSSENFAINLFSDLMICSIFKIMEFTSDEIFFFSCITFF